MWKRKRCYIQVSVCYIYSYLVVFVFLPYVIYADVINTTTTTTTTTKAVGKQNDDIQCDDGWIPFGTSCYKFFSNFEYFDTARLYCQRNGEGDLVTIHNNQENEFINKMIAKSALYKETWIGLKREDNAFHWTNNDDVMYKNWFINRPTQSGGDCTQMIPGGLWVNILCYNQLQFICKKAPTILEDNSELYLIIHVTIPVSCVAIMFFFVAYLCFKSHRELNELKHHTKDANPFQIVQAAMELPSSSDLFKPNKGISLWQNALEKIKQEQFKENDSNNNNSSSSNHNRGFSKISEPETDLPPANDFALLVKSVMRRRSETFNGTLGAPAATTPDVVITNTDVNKTGENKPINRLRNVARKTMSDPNNVGMGASAHTDVVRKPRSQSNLVPPPSESFSKVNNSAINLAYNYSLDKEDVVSPTQSTEIFVWLKNARQQRNDKPTISANERRKREFSLRGKSAAIDIQDGGENNNNSNNDDVIDHQDERIIGELDLEKKDSNLVEVIVDVNSGKRRSTDIIHIQSPRKRPSDLALVNTIPETQTAHIWETQSPQSPVHINSLEESRVTHPNSSSINLTENQSLSPARSPTRSLTQSPTRSPTRSITQSQTRSSTRSLTRSPTRSSTRSQNQELDKETFTKLIRKESLKRKNKYFPDLKDRDNTDEDTYKEPPVTTFKFMNDNYLKSTLV